MIGQAKINGKDIWSEYRANLVKGAYQTLTGALAFKDYVSNTSRLEDGDRVVPSQYPNVKSREFTIQITVEGSDYESLIYNFNALSEDAAGYIDFSVPKLKCGFKLILREVTDATDYKLHDGRLLRIAKFKFYEPNPINRFTV
jgi:hypothetical protein